MEKALQIINEWVVKGNENAVLRFVDFDIHALPSIPDNVKRLFLINCKLNEPPYIPNNIEHLNLINVHIETLPNLSPNFEFIWTVG